jgi:hypothetical protein
MRTETARGSGHCWCDGRFKLAASELEKLSYADNGFVVYVYRVADVNVYM